MKICIAAENVSLTLGRVGSSNWTEVLRSFSFEFVAGRCYSILGPNGCGKSTLLDLLAGLRSPDVGALTGCCPSKQRVAMVFQDFRESLLPWLTVEENITWPAIHDLKEQSNTNSGRAALHYVASRFRLDRRVATLSGGQCQLVAFARAWAFAPTLLLCDEPFSALDLHARREMALLMMSSMRDLDAAMIVITHSVEDAVAVADEVLVVEGPPLKVLCSVAVEGPSRRSHEYYSSVEFLRTIAAVERAIPHMTDSRKVWNQL
jgi:ABC-type nitrate/sulfonate/bicarbonate transport system ATPase subunit